MAYPLGTVVASPVVGGSSGDTYGTHYSYLGVGGWQEFASLNERNNIPTDTLGNLDASGLGSGRRRLGMLVYVAETDTIYQLFLPYPSWTGLTSSQKVSALANNSNWIEFSSGGGDAIKKKYSQPSHGFSVGNVVSFNGTSYVKGIADEANTYEFLGLVSSVIDADTFTLTYAGFMDLTSLTGMSANTTYFVSPTIPGAITPVEPFSPGQSSRPILMTQESTKGLVLMMRSFTVSSESITGGTASGLRIERQTEQTGHGFSLGDVVMYSGGSYHKAVALESIHGFPVGLVREIFDANTFMLTFAGYIEGMNTATDDLGSPITASTTYYLSPTSPGKLTKTKPTAAGQLVKPIYQSINAFDGIVVNQKGTPTFLPISGITNLQTELDSKIDSSEIGAPGGIVPLGVDSKIDISYIPGNLKEIFVVANIAERDSRFVASGATPGAGQIESFEGLKVFVIQTSGSTGTTSGLTGSVEFIDTTGFLEWSATTSTVHISYNDITDIPALVNQITAGDGIDVTNSGTGNTTVSVDYDDVYIDVNGNSLQVKESSIDATRVKFQTTGGTTGQFVVRGTGDTFNVIDLPASVIGPAEDGDYTDGVFTDFTPTTPTGTAIDRFNELFLLLLPAQPSSLTSINTINSFVSGKLTWGVSKTMSGYVNVGTNAGNAAVDLNGTYSASGTRLGIINGPVSGTLNSAVTGDSSGIPYLDNAFSNGDQGKLVMYRNGSIIAQLTLSGTTAATSNSYFSVTSVKNVKSDNGSPVTTFKYRTGTYTIPVSGMTGGFNYIRIMHTGATFSTLTNYLEFVYDNNANNIALSSTGLTNLTLSGTKWVSGVKFHTSGTVQYQGTISNAYRNVYSTSSSAIDFPNRENLGDITSMNVIGTGTTGRTSSTLKTLPPLLTSTNSHLTSLSVLATLPISTTKLLGNVGSTGRIASAISVAHPFTSKQVSGGLSTLTGFLFYNVSDSATEKSEPFIGETYRLQTRDYTSLTYANVDGGTYNWDSTSSLVGASAFHNTGLLVFNDELMYPNAAYLTTQYGITTGNFAAVTNAPVGNDNYTSASGNRSHYRLFKSTAGATQSTLTFAIVHNGTSSNFLTNGGTGGTVSGNNIKFEFLIMRSGGAKHGWANPFASVGNTEGIANTSISHVGSTTTVSCTLSTVPRVALGDIVIVRIIASSGWTNRIQTVTVSNI